MQNIAPGRVQGHYCDNGHRLLAFQIEKNGLPDIFVTLVKGSNVDTVTLSVRLSHIAIKLQICMQEMCAES